MNMEPENSVVSGQDSTAIDENDIPAVVVVVVAKDPGGYFEDMLFSVGSQDYQNVSVLVVDAGSAEPIADRVATVLPEAYLHRIVGDPGWSVAANQSMELVSGSPFLLFCHDDVVLEQSCISTLMAEMYKSNAGIVGPKLVSWDDPRRLLQIGMSSDRFGVAVDQIERGEFDQEQYDSPRDMFYVPGGVQLVRSDLLAAVGGFDDAISFLGEDLDLCWRAHAAGAKVRVVPRAKAKHIESVSHRISPGFKQKLQTRHRLRTVITTSSTKSLFINVPLAVLLIFIESLYALFNGRRKHAKELLSAITWNLSRFSSSNKRRKQLEKIRKLSDKEIRTKQVGGSAKISGFWRNKFEAGQSRLDSVLSNTGSGPDPSSTYHSSVIYGLTLIVLLFASRSLIISGYNVFGQIPQITNSVGILREWFGGWRSAGTGGPGNSPLAFLILGVLRFFLFWAPSVFQKLVILVPLFLGFWGATRLARPFGSSRLRSVAGAMYVFNPIVFWMLRAGRWDSFVIWAAIPFVLTSLLKVAEVAPFVQKSDSEDVFFIPRTFPVRVLRFGFLVAAVATFSPSVVVVAALMALSLAIVSTINVIAFRGFIFSALAAVVVPVVLHIPWSYDIVRDFSWDWLVGSKSPESTDMGLLDLFIFRTVDSGPGLFGDGFDLSVPLLAVAGLVLPLLAFLLTVTAKKNSSKFVLFGWSLAIGMWFLIWLDNAELLPIAMPAVESLLAPVAMGLILIIVSVAVEYEKTYFRSVSRLKMMTSAVGLLGLVIVFVGGATMAISGRWGMPDLPRGSVASSLYIQQNSTDEISTKGRILWVGDPSVVPVEMNRSDLGYTYAVTDEYLDIRNKWISGPLGNTSGVGDQLDLVAQGGTASVGKLLAPHGIQYIIVAEQLARDYTVNEIPSEISDGLSKQVDLKIDNSGSVNFTVYENRASGGFAAAISESVNASGIAALDKLSLDLSREEPIEAGPIPANPGKWRVVLPENKDVFISVPSKDLEVKGVRNSVQPGVSGMSVLTSGASGEVELSYAGSYFRKLALVLQFLIIGSGVVVAQTRKGGEL